MGGSRTDKRDFPGDLSDLRTKQDSDGCGTGSDVKHQGREEGHWQRGPCPGQ